MTVVNFLMLEVKTGVKEGKGEVTDTLSCCFIDAEQKYSFRHRQNNQQIITLIQNVSFNKNYIVLLDVKIHDVGFLSSSCFKLDNVSMLLL